MRLGVIQSSFMTDLYGMVIFLSGAQSFKTFMKYCKKVLSHWLISVCVNKSPHVVDSNASLIRFICSGPTCLWVKVNVVFVPYMLVLGNDPIYPKIKLMNVYIDTCHI